MAFQMRTGAWIRQSSEISRQGERFRTLCDRMSQFELDQTSAQNRLLIGMRFAFLFSQSLSRGDSSRAD